MLTLRFDSPEATLDNSGGKALNLVRLTRAGFPVPPGFVLTTEAYRKFVAANGLGGAIRVALEDADPGDPASLERSAAAIRTAFRGSTIPREVQEKLNTAAGAWAQTSLAVRSSATAEDLPELSFAGQQDTFLNVIGLDSLRAAVVECWASLWSARAIGYRARAGVPNEGVALAVVIQRLVDAEVSGVMFTANPLTGHRGQAVIDATYGLGEALVSGGVEPDQLVVDRKTGAIISSRAGSKASRTVKRKDGGVQTLAQQTYDFALTPDQASDLVELGNRVQDLYGEPQDIEWAIADGQLHLLQARPITSLFPLPEQADSELAVWFSAGAFQGFLNPITPLGIDVLRGMIGGAATLFGLRYPRGVLPGVGVAGGRLWGRLDPVLRHPWGRRLMPHLLEMVEPGSASTVERLLADNRLYVNRRGGLHTFRLLSGLLGAIVLRAPLSLSAPAAYRRAFQFGCERFVRRVRAEADAASALGDPRERLAARLRSMDLALASAFPRLIPRFAPIMGPSILMTRELGEFADRAGPGLRSLVLESLRSLPGNPTTEMDMALWAAAEKIRGDMTSAARFRRLTPDDLAREYSEGSLPSVATSAVAGFLQRYGMRGAGEIDLGVPRWSEDPTPILATIQGYLALKDPEQAPDAVFKRGEDAALRASNRLASLALDGTWRGQLRYQRLRFMVSRIRGMFGARETPKFTIIRIFGIAREGLLASGADLVEAGVLADARDIFFLQRSELDAPWRWTDGELAELVLQRRSSYNRELERRQVPRLLLGDGETFYDGAGHGVPEGAIVGTPVSPGIVEGRVRVVLDPAKAGLQPGEILVCPGTDPAWTPLFMTAGGLVTEVGGLMTHGSVVAREYGIPAVVGVHAATTRLVTGNLIRLDGNTGAIEVLE